MAPRPKQNTPTTDDPFASVESVESMPEAIRKGREAEPLPTHVIEAVKASYGSPKRLPVTQANAETVDKMLRRAAGQLGFGMSITYQNVDGETVKRGTPTAVWAYYQAKDLVERTTNENRKPVEPKNPRKGESAAAFAARRAGWEAALTRWYVENS